MYQQILNKFEEKYLRICDKKPIISFKISIGKNKKLVFELSREKSLWK